MTAPTPDEAAAQMVARLTMGEPLLPWPELSQDMGFIAFTIRNLTAERDALRAEVERAQQLAVWRAIQLSEVDQLRARIQAVRDLAARQPDRFLGWSVERPDGSSCFGTFSEQAGAERCAADVRRGLCPDARIVESYAPGSVDVDELRAALGPVETPQEDNR